MIVTPPLYTGIHDEEIDLNKPSNEETMRKMIQNHNYLGDLIPLASILTININQPGSDPVDTDVWQICDGSEIVHPDSPLRSIGVDLRFTPDIDQKYIKGSNTLTDNSQGGTQTIDFSHDHGWSGVHTKTFLIFDNDGDDSALIYYDDHAHFINSAGVVTPDYPKWYKVAAYMKIQ